MKGTEITTGRQGREWVGHPRAQQLHGLQVGGLTSGSGAFTHENTRLGGGGGVGWAQPLKSSNELSQGLHQGSREDILCHTPTEYNEHPDLL